MITRMDLIDRESEAAELRALAESGTRKLALLFGRRRVGKTYLLNSLWGPERTFCFTASATTPEINRRVLIEEAARWSGETLRSRNRPCSSSPAGGSRSRSARCGGPGPPARPLDAGRPLL